MRYCHDNLSKAFDGAGDEVEYAPGKGGDFALVNLGPTLSKDRSCASCVVIPDNEKSYLVLRASFRNRRNLLKYFFGVPVKSCLADGNLLVLFQ